MTNTIQGDVQSAIDRHLYGDQRRRLLRRAEAVELRRQPAGVRRHRPLHPARRLPARQERLSGQRRRLLPDGHSGRPVDRQPGRQRSAAAAVPERLPAGAGDHADRVSRQSRRLSADGESADQDIPRSELLDPTTFSSNPIASAPVAARITGSARSSPTSSPACRAPVRSPCRPRRNWAPAMAARCASRSRRRAASPTNYDIVFADTDTLNDVMSDINGLAGLNAAVTAIDRHHRRHQQAADRRGQRRLRFRDQCVLDRYADHAARSRVKAFRTCRRTCSTQGVSAGRNARHHRRCGQLQPHVRNRRR